MSGPQSSLQMELTKVLFAKCPGLLQADTMSSAYAASEVANLMGCILSCVLLKDGPDRYAESLRAVVQKVDQAAHDVTLRAQIIAATTPAGAAQ